MNSSPVYNERLRFCRELHDGTVQDILGALLTLRMMPAADQQSALALREDAIRALEQALKGARSLIREVRSARALCTAESQESDSLASVINRYVVPVAARGGIQLELRVDPSIAVPHVHLEELGHIVREVARNVVRHANATRLEITATRTAGSTSIDMRDDGTGFQSIEPLDGFGIPGIAERAALLGGTVLVSTCRGLGTLVRVLVPFAASHPGSRLALAYGASEAASAALCA